MFQVVVVFGLSEQHVRQKKNLYKWFLQFCLRVQFGCIYLSRSESQCCGEEEIGIGRAGVNPQIPQDGAEDRSHQENAADDKGMSEN